MGCRAPLHLLGLDRYNVPEASTYDRFTRVKKQLPAATAARAIRIVPAFGLGGILNKRLRHDLARPAKRSPGASPQEAGSRPRAGGQQGATGDGREKHGFHSACP